jgi:hypothetical protein
MPPVNRSKGRPWVEGVGDAFPASIALYEELDRVEWISPRKLTGTLAYTGEWDDLLEILEDHGSLVLQHEGTTLPLARLKERATETSVTVELDVPSGESAYFVRNLQDLLKAPQFRHRRPGQLYLADQRTLVPDETSQDVAKYEEAIAFADLCKAAADHAENRTGELILIFLYPDDKLEIPIKYDPDDLGALTDVQGLRSELDEQPNVAVKHTLFRGAIRETVGALPEDDRFAALCLRFAELRKRYRTSLELYLKEFSFESKREELEKIKREYLGKINGAVDNIHARLIALPAAVVIVANQLRPATGAADVVHNTVVLLGALVFTGLMMMIAGNQRHHLEAIWTEIDMRRKRIADRTPKFYQENAAAFDELERRYKHQIQLLRGISAIVWLGLFVSLFVYCLYLPIAVPSESSLFWVPLLPMSSS